MLSISNARATSSRELAWARNFVARLEEDPGAYMVDPPTIAGLRQRLDRLAAAFKLAGVVRYKAVTPDAYTQPLRAALYTARNDFRGMASQVSFQIHANNAVSDQSKLLAGIKPRNFMRTPRGRPSTQPMLDLGLAMNGAHEIIFRDITSPNVRAKPFGVTHLLLFMAVSEHGPKPHFNDARLQGVYTRTPMVVKHEEKHNAKMATYWACWMNMRGQMGPLSAPIAATIMFAR